MTTMTFAQTVPVGVADVFGWHGRPGALERLLPPWQPVQAVQEATSLRDGTAILRLPGGLRWVAKHQPAGYEPDRCFVDELTSLPLRWRHEHRFEPIERAETRVVDRVSTVLPARALRSMFGYRHRQLAGDLAAHAVAAGLRPAPLRVGVTGSGGLVGSALCAFLSGGGHEVIRLVRRPPDGPQQRRWDPAAPDRQLLTGLDAVVHLAGAPIAGRFTAAHRRSIRDSRVEPTRRLAELAAATPGGPRVLVAASAVGYYGPDRGDTVLAETEQRGDGFLADVVADWEAATRPLADAGGRVVNVRTGIVQTPRGGVLRLLYPVFATGLGGPLGDGRQWVSWIGIDDLLDVYLRCLVDDQLAGAVNAVAPEPVRFGEYASTLAAVLHRPALVPVPASAARLLFGEQGAREFALASQRVQPARLRQCGHIYRRPDLRAALAHVLGTD